MYCMPLQLAEGSEAAGREDAPAKSEEQRCERGTCSLTTIVAISAVSTSLLLLLAVVLLLLAPWQEPAPSLFCFLLMQSDSYEVRLVQEQFDRGVGIFACDEYSAFSDMELPLGSKTDLRAAAIPGPLRVRRDPRYNYALNTRVFLRVWSRVVADAKYRSSSWTVKVDPDTVFLPQRLRERLAEGPAHGAKLSFINCRFGLHGPIEVLSRSAVATLGAGMDRCRLERAVGLDTEGEDMFLSRCLDLLGVLQVEDYGLLSEEACMERPFPCRSGKVAFHPLKEANMFLQCLKQAGG